MTDEADEGPDLYFLNDNTFVTGQRAADLLDDERIKHEMTRADLARAKGLLASANKWVRLVEERREDVPHWFRHDADPTPLRKTIDQFLS